LKLLLAIIIGNFGMFKDHTFAAGNNEMLRSEILAVTRFSGGIVELLLSKAKTACNGRLINYACSAARRG
jgi:hypothetical protein